jgi:hypothetical protein
MDSARENAEVIKAWADGKIIQYIPLYSESDPADWVDFNVESEGAWGPWSCAPEYQWRIKPETKTIWVNVYPSTACGHQTKQQADRRAANNRLACVQVTYTEGEGLN